MGAGAAWGERFKAGARWRIACRSPAGAHWGGAGGSAKGAGGRGGGKREAEKSVDREGALLCLPR